MYVLVNLYSSFYGFLLLLIEEALSLTSTKLCPLSWTAETLLQLTQVQCIVCVTNNSFTYPNF